MDYLTHDGFDPAASEAQTLADAILLQLQNLAAGHLPPNLTGQPYSGQVPSIRYSMSGTHLVNFGEYGWLFWFPWYTPIALPLWLLLSLITARWMMRRYRRRLGGEKSLPQLSTAPPR